MRKLYLAGPLFNESERQFAERISSVLSARFEVYVPHLEGGLVSDMVARGEPPEVVRARIFNSDIAALKHCDDLLIILNGRTVDEGAAFELGVAWSFGKTCFGYKTIFGV